MKQLQVKRIFDVNNELVAANNVAQAIEAYRLYTCQTIEPVAGDKVEFVINAGKMIWLQEGVKQEHLMMFEVEGQLVAANTMFEAIAVYYATYSIDLDTIERIAINTDVKRIGRMVWVQE